MQTIIESKTAVVGAVPAGSAIVFFSAVVDKVPSAAQIEAARNTLEASLELVGATSTTAYLTKFAPAEADKEAGEKLLVKIDASLTKTAPDEPDDAEI
jgi:hypothetical protein